MYRAVTLEETFARRTVNWRAGRRMRQGSELVLTSALPSVFLAVTQRGKRRGEGDGFTRQNLHTVQSNALLASPRSHGGTASPCFNTRWSGTLCPVKTILEVHFHLNSFIKDESCQVFPPLLAPSWSWQTECWMGAQRGREGSQGCVWRRVQREA